MAGITTPYGSPHGAATPSTAGPPRTPAASPRSALPVLAASAKLARATLDEPTKPLQPYALTAAALEPLASTSSAPVRPSRQLGRAGAENTSFESTTSRSSWVTSSDEDSEPCVESRRRRSRQASAARTRTHRPPDPLLLSSSSSARTSPALAPASPRADRLDAPILLPPSCFDLEADGAGDAAFLTEEERRAKALEKDEPLLQESADRFVLFPIRYNEVRSSCRILG